jgi:hypothetical protein
VAFLCEVIWFGHLSTVVCFEDATYLHVVLMSYLMLNYLCIFFQLHYAMSNKQMTHECWKVHPEEKIFQYEIVQYRRCGIVHKAQSEWQFILGGY